MYPAIGRTCLQRQDDLTGDIGQHQSPRQLFRVQGARPVAVEHQHPDPDRPQAGPITHASGGARRFAEWI